MKQRFVVVSEHEVHAAWLERALAPEGEAVVADEPSPERIAQLSDAASSSVVFVRVDAADQRPRSELIAQLLARKPHLGIIAISDTPEQGAILAAIRAGARDFLTVGGDERDAQQAVARLLETMPSPKDAERGEQIAILCPRPDIATSTFVVHLALHFIEHTEADDKVLLVDLGLPAADSLFFLDIEPSYGFIDAVRSVRRFDETLIETAFSRDRSGLAVLPLVGDPAQMQDVKANDMLALFSILKNYFRRTVLNLGGLRSPQFLVEALAQADDVLLLADQSVASCSAARKLLDGLGDLGYATDRIQLVFDRYTPTIDPDPQRVSELLGLPVATTLAPNGLAMVRAMNSATTIFESSPGSPYAQGVRALADRMMGREEETPEASGPAEWLRGLRRLLGSA